MPEAKNIMRRARRVVQFVGLFALSNVLSCGDGPTAVQALVDNVVVTTTLTKLVVGQQVQADAIARDAAGKKLAGITINWASSNSAVATITPEGLITAVAPGSSDITASAGKLSATVTFSVQQPPTQLGISQQPSATA